MGPLEPNSRLTRLSPSPVRAIFERANQIEAAGGRVLHLEIGRPDIDTPVHIKGAAEAALAAGLVHYGPSNGIVELREAIADDLGRDRAAAVDPDGIIVTTGAAEAIALAAMAFLEPHDEVIIPVPAWPNYERYAAWAGATPVYMRTDEDDVHQLSGAGLRRAMTTRTRMLILCSPHNPTGTILSERSLREIATELEGSRVIVLADEIYKKLTYTGSSFIAPASLSPDMAARTITVGGFSKAYAMDGWRLGYFVASADTARHALKLKQLLTVCSPVFLQHGAVAALRGPDDALRRATAEYQRRRDALVRAVAEQGAVSASTPQGGFYLYLRYPAHLPPSAVIAEQLLTQEGVAVVPGEFFGASQEHHLRISFSAAAKDVLEGAERILRLLGST